MLVRQSPHLPRVRVTFATGLRKKALQQQTLGLSLELMDNYVDNCGYGGYSTCKSLIYKESHSDAQILGMANGFIRMSSRPVRRLFRQSLHNPVDKHEQGLYFERKSLISKDPKGHAQILGSM